MLAESAEMETIFHLAPWHGFCLEGYAPGSLESEGFIHLSNGSQLLKTANRWFAEAADLAVLVIDPASLGEALVWEDLYGHGDEYPHLYGPLPEESILSIVRMKRGQHDLYEWPTQLLSSALTEPLTCSPGLIEPSQRFPNPSLPQTCVLTFFGEAMESVPPLSLGSEIGATRVGVLEHEGRQVAICNPGYGGPVAAAALEELIALGCRRFVVCGGAGSLQPELQLGHLVVVEEALRDEGLSHHYLSPAFWVKSDPQLLALAQRVLSAGGVPFKVGKTWTTDALYRETPERIARRRQQDCLTVEMEAASLLAVAQFREVSLLPILYCGDDLSTETWNFREWTTAQSIRDKLFRLALEIAVAGQ